ncbi:hypothetical protein [Streptomyces sp. LN785]
MSSKYIHRASVFRSAIASAEVTSGLMNGTLSGSSSFSRCF